MSEFIREVEEDIRRERLQRVWKRFAPFVYGAAALIILITAANQGYEYWQSSRAAASGDRFLAALDLFEEGKTEEAVAALDGLKADGTGQYPVLAQFKAASILEGDAAVAAFDTLATDAAVPAALQNLAAIGAAFLLVDGGDLAAVEQRVGALLDAENPYRHSAREAIALAAYAAGDLQRAGDTASAITADAETPASIRQRAQLIADVVAAKQ